MVFDARRVEDRQHHLIFVSFKSFPTNSAEGWSSYLGIATKGMPNFLMTMGSHTSLGHNSMIAMMECQTNYIVSFIKQVSEDERRSSFVLFHHWIP